MEHPPPFHIFGHDHEHFGVYTEAGGRTVALNAAQEGLRRADRRGGGQAWVFDAPLR
jgi:Icc-related predicted phosphoesterase